MDIFCDRNEILRVRTQRIILSQPENPDFSENKLKKRSWPEKSIQEDPQVSYEYRYVTKYVIAT